MKGDKKSDRCIGDYCLVCGKHPSGGGHYFEGIEDEYGNFNVLDKGRLWLVVEYTDYIWFCPDCRKYLDAAFKETLS